MNSTINVILVGKDKVEKNIKNQFISNNNNYNDIVIIIMIIIKMKIIIMT